jgi:predicted TIM-barrel fold metal-dependent hydrolase
MAGGLLADFPLVDAHCHLLLAEPVDRAAFERCCTEAGQPSPPGVSTWDTGAGLSIRRWCPPVLGLEPFASPSDYLRRRRELELVDVTSLLLGAAGLSDLLVDTGLHGRDAEGQALGGLGDLAAGARAWEVVRLERVAEEVAAGDVSAASFASAVADHLAVAAEGAVAVKSILAYRWGLDIDPDRPCPADVRKAAGEWLGSAPGRRLDHPVLLRFLLWAGVDLGLPIQIHTGFGDRDLVLARADPSLLQPWLAQVEPAGVPIVLLHCYPFHRQAAWLAAVHPHVYVDVGLTLGQVGAGAQAVLAEFLELAPFAKVMFSTDGYRLPELFLIGAAQFRLALGRLLDEWIGGGLVGPGDAERVAGMVAGENARRVYRRLPE